MNLKSYQLCDDWGWFIDIETNNFGENVLLQPCSRPRIKKFNSRVNNLPTIEEDEYEYYQKNYKDPEEILYKDVQQNYATSLKNSKENVNNTVFNVGSTTLITAILTYVIFIVL
jgi:hypothetical protein